MFKHHDRAVYMDLSSELRDPLDWKAGTLRALEHHLDIVVFAVEPLNGFLAVGTSSGVIHIFGGPGVESRLTLSEPLRIKFLQFAISVFKLVCVDEQDRLHVWDLGIYGEPKLQQTTGFHHSVNSLTLSPSHTHAFLALHSGEIKTYDLICLRKSPYVIPNMWALYEKKMEASGMDIPSVPGSQVQIPVEVVIHPRDLNLVFVAYGGGVVLSDLTQRNTLRAYEYMLPAGAPGGTGYGSSDLLTHRRPSVTSMAVHPAGHYFAVGYADGSIAFWAVEDEDQPFLVRTVDEIDVHVVDGDKLEEHLSQDKRTTVPIDREPIFKLAWSGFSNSTDPRGGESALTILGGLPAGEPPGLNVHWLPAFNPSEPPTPTGTQVGLHPGIRKAMRASILPLKTFFYAGSGTTQDFLLTSQNNPHFAGAFDPTSILILSENPGGTRAIDVYEFPPPAFLEPATPILEKSQPASHPHPEDDLVQDLASTLQSMKIEIEPRQIQIPSALWSRSDGGYIVKLERETYQTLVVDGEHDSSHDNLPLKGGVAWTDESMNTESKLAKYQPHRVLVTHHRDLSVHFQDISAQLLTRPNRSPMQFDFPRHLSSLVIDVASVLVDAAVATHTSARFIDHASIDCTRLASDSLECAVVLKTGELLVYRLRSGQQGDIPYREAADTELVVLEHVSQDRGTRYHPYFMLAAGRGAATACEISDIGFVAVAYTDGSLFIVDMRGPKVILRYGQDKKAKHRQSVGLHLKSATAEPFTVLTWTVSRHFSDPRLHIRLVATADSGASKIFTITRDSSGSWIAGTDAVEAEAMAHPLPHGSFIIDAKSGARWAADRNRLAITLQTTTAASNGSHCLWITCGTKGVKCVVNITGDRLSKMDWSNKHGVVRSVEIVERNGSHALVAFTDKHEALIYSLPHLEFLHTLQLPCNSDEPLSTDETGDYVEWMRHPQSGVVEQATLGTLFDIRRAYAVPDMDLTTARNTIPSQPQPVSVGPASLLSSWFRSGQSMTGEQVDALLAGPDRPIPEPPERPSQGWRAADYNSAYDGASSVLKSAQEAQSSIYNRLAAAVSERGQKLGDLEESFNSLEEGSKSMVTEAKKLAASQTTKKWFNF